VTGKRCTKLREALPRELVVSRGPIGEMVNRKSLFVALLVMACGRGGATADRGAYEALPFPTTIGIPVAEIERAVRSKFGTDEALDEDDLWVREGASWRSRAYSLEVPPVAIDVGYRYRGGDGRVWAIQVAHAYHRFSGNIGEVDFSLNVSEIERVLGPPVQKQTIAPVLDEYVWVRQDLTYVVEAFNQDHEDISLSGREGDVTSVFVYSKHLGPSGFVGHHRPNRLNG
jgi:hypothetical protein